LLLLILLSPLALSLLYKVTRDAEFTEERGWVFHFVDLLSDLTYVFQALSTTFALDEVFTSLLA
jgi:hypothetical protein